MVLRDRPHPKLLPLRPLRPRLEIPLVVPTCPRLGHRPPRHRLLHRRLGRLPLPLRRPFKIPLLDPAHVCRRPRRPALVSDAMGDVRNGAVGSLGGIPARGRYGRADAVAVAGRAGYNSGSRVRDDFAADADALSYRLYAGLRAGAGQRGDDCGEGVRAGQRRAGQCVSKPGAEFGRVAECVVLGCVGVPVEYLRGVFQVFQKGGF